jgi:sec-independent protein translocase protein TatA
MLDNLGFGEIAMLALMALLFFGPERLPQIGARIGRWIATLTQSSKAFMNEWRDEALVVYEAVEEVKGIRDEIIAARAEIAGTVTTARDDVGEALSGARADVQAQVQGATTFSPTSERSGDADTYLVGTGEDQRGGTPDRAIERTEEILAGLRENRGGTDPAVSTRESPQSIKFSDANPLNQSAQHLWHQTAPGARKALRRETQAAAAPVPSSAGVEQSTQLPSPPSERRIAAETPALHPQRGASVPSVGDPAVLCEASLSSLRETVIALEADVRALRGELARTRTALEAKALSMGSQALSRAESEATTPEADTAPHPAQVGEQA